MEEHIRVMVVRPGKQPKMELLENELKPLQEAVGGYLEWIGLGEDAILLCDEEGKMKGLEPNRHIGDDIVCGTFLICGVEGENFASLTKEQEEEYGERFSQPEDFSFREITGLSMFSME